MKKRYYIFVLFIVLLVQNVWSEPTVNGLFYGDGDESEYVLYNTSIGGSKLWYTVSGNRLYVALVVDRSVNDNVFSPQSNSAYTQSAGYPNHRSAKKLTDSEFAQFTLTIGSTTIEWQQGYAGQDNSSTWVSNHLAGAGNGTPPPDYISSSSIVWNFNNYANNPSPYWNLYHGGTNLKDWKSPFDPSDPDTVYPPNPTYPDDPANPGNGLEGYPATGELGFSTNYQWEWSMVYEWSCDLSTFGSDPIWVISGMSHHSPTKSYDWENDEFPPLPPGTYLSDYGDLPDSYNTLLANTGAYHYIIPNGIYLGSTVDPEPDGLPDSAALGDDNSASDDEDGVIFTDNWYQGTTANISVTASGTGNLSAWADFNNNNSFDAGEQIFADQVLSSGVNSLQVTIPNDAVLGQVNTRFRFSTDINLGSTGLANDGEVEDYQIEVAQEPASLGNYVWHDLDQNGLQDGYEPGLPGIVVNLYNDGVNPVQTTTTDSNGYYLFENLTPGTYYVEFVKDNWTITIQDFGSNDELDSDADVQTGQTGTYILAAGEVNLTVDCGMYSSDPLPVTLSSFNAIFAHGNARLQWTTQSESNNALWNIYRSISNNVGQAQMINYESLPGSGTTSEPTDYTYYDNSLDELVNAENLVNPTIYYWLESMDHGGSTELHGPVSITVLNSEEGGSTPEVPDVYGLNQNYPNPFNPDTGISFNLAQAGKASLHIYNVKGERVKTVFQDKECAKNRKYTEYWNGKDNRGNTVSSGIYLAVLKTDKELFTRKMILQK